ncbi:RNA chaperone ProQ [Thalassotalea agarivorans]|uniref:RNA chaperone ProQ n=1 Tax=Thalassotalea agarivorans TaxID=349064 RepID=A0A1I0BXM3_THASX|nr:RNA chaperone ProQ [Thalassotalea agarivorans]SET11451.1 ProP effector [Thalassotalea agarivorans]
METEIKKVTTKEIISYLAEKFPACFSVEGPAKPLKVGIFQDLAEQLAEDEQVSKTRLRQALRHYTSSWRYLKSVKAGAFRVDLAGEQVAEIDKEQADYAAKTLKESQEKFGNKKSDDSQAKKSYKGTKVSDKRSDKNKQNAKFKSVKSPKRGPKKPVEPLKPVESDALKVGTQVRVKVGNSPMPAVITEIAGSDISVQLTSGMIVKTQLEHIFL